MAIPRGKLNRRYGGCPAKPKRDANGSRAAKSPASPGSRASIHGYQPGPAPQSRPSCQRGHAVWLLLHSPVGLYTAVSPWYTEHPLTTLPHPTSGRGIEAQTFRYKPPKQTVGRLPTPFSGADTPSASPSIDPCAAHRQRVAGAGTSTQEDAGNPSSARMQGPCPVHQRTVARGQRSVPERAEGTPVRRSTQSGCLLRGEHLYLSVAPGMALVLGCHTIGTHTRGCPSRVSDAADRDLGNKGGGSIVHAR